MKTLLLILCLLLLPTLLYAGGGMMLGIVGGGTPAAGGPSALYTAAVAVWDFESGTGTVDTKGTHTLTANADATISATLPAVGTYSGLCDGTGDYWSLADDPAFDLAGNYSVSFWVKLTTAADCSFIQKYASGEGWEVSSTYITDGWKFVVQNYAGWADTTASFTTYTTPTATWIHLVIVYDGAHIIAYGSVATFGDVLNAVEVDCTRNPGANTAELWIGRGNEVGTGYLNGRLDEVVVWGSAITATDAANLFAKSWR